MRAISITFILLSTFGFSQIKFNSPDDLNLFKGDLSNFILEAERLRLNATEAGNSQLIHVFNPTNSLELSLELELQFPPSNSNSFSLFIGEDSLYQNGYLLEIGENGTDDAFNLSEVNQGAITSLARGVEGKFAASFKSKITIKLNDSITIKRNDTTEIKMQNLAKKTCQYIAMRCKYTKTRKDKFFIDDFTLSLAQNVNPPTPTVLTYKKFDLWITELMVDPSPTRQLPDSEYIELYNSTNNPINLKDWSLTINENKIYLPEIWIDDYLVLTNITLGLKDESLTEISLPNNSFSISLKSPNDKLIYNTNFDSKLKPDERSNGGYSYELQWMDSSATELNWHYTEAFAGGTPGQENSIVTNDLLKNRVFYIQNGKQTTWLGSTATDSVIKEEKIGELDLELSEILYRPRDQGSEFIELYNIGESGKTSDLWIAYETSLLKIPNDIYIPKECFVLLTDNFYGLQRYYDIPFDCVIIVLDDFPEILTEGSVGLYQKEKLLWKYPYNDDLENGLLDNSEGVSLEKTSYYENKWTSGNMNYGGATPGAKNSSQHTSEQIEFSSETWVFHQLTKEPITINVKNSDGSYILDLKLFSKSGREIRTIFEDFHLDATGEVFLNLNQEDLGFYFIYLELKNDQGSIKTFKKPVVVAY